MGRIDEPKDREAGEGTAGPLSRKEQGAAGERDKPAGKKPARKKPAGKTSAGKKPPGKKPVKGMAGGKAPRKQFGKPGGKGAGVEAKAGDKPRGFGGKPRFGGKPTGVGARLAGKRFDRPGDKSADAGMGDFADRPLRGNIGKRGGMPGINPLGERGPQHLGSPKPFGTPGARFAVQPGAERLGRPGARPVGGPGAKPVGRPGAERLGRPGAKPVGGPGARLAAQPAAQPLGRPGAKPVGRPVGRPGAKPMGGPGAKPVGRPGPRPVGSPAAQPGVKPLGRPGAKVPLRAAAKRQPDRPAEALSAPKLDALAAAKLAWQPTLTWCVKQLRVTHTMDPGVQTAVEQFHTWVKAVVSASDAAQFREAQAKAVSSVNEHQFLRWAPLPSPLPSL